jgi:cytochrome c-type biogenesis protein CcmH
VKPALAALAAAVVLALAPVAASAACPRARLPDIEGQVMCLVCGVPLSVADSPQATRERGFISGEINRCESAAEIKRALVAQYGPRVLALPADGGFSTAAYVVPLLILLLGGGAAAAAVRWWATAGGASSPAVVPPPPTRADARRLDDEIARWDR